MKDVSVDSSSHHLYSWSGVELIVYSVEAARSQDTAEGKSQQKGWRCLVHSHYQMAYCQLSLTMLNKIN